MKWWVGKCCRAADKRLLAGQCEIKDRRNRLSIGEIDDDIEVFLALAEIRIYRELIIRIGNYVSACNYLVVVALKAEVNDNLAHSSATTV